MTQEEKSLEDQALEALGIRPMTSDEYNNVVATLYRWIHTQPNWSDVELEGSALPFDPELHGTIITQRDHHRTVHLTNKQLQESNVALDYYTVTAQHIDLELLPEAINAASCVIVIPSGREITGKGSQATIISLDDLALLGPKQGWDLYNAYSNSNLTALFPARPTTFSPEQDPHGELAAMANTEVARQEVLRNDLAFQEEFNALFERYNNEKREDKVALDEAREARQKAERHRNRAEAEQSEQTERQAMIDAWGGYLCDKPGVKLATSEDYAAILKRVAGSSDATVQAHSGSFAEEHQPGNYPWLIVTGKGEVDLSDAPESCLIITMGDVSVESNSRVVDSSFNDPDVRFPLYRDDYFALRQTLRQSQQNDVGLSQ